MKSVTASIRLPKKSATAPSPGIRFITAFLTLSKLATNKPRPTTIAPTPVATKAIRKAFNAPVEVPITKVDSFCTVVCAFVDLVNISLASTASLTVIASPPVASFNNPIAPPLSKTDLPVLAIDERKEAFCSVSSSKEFSRR